MIKIIHVADEKNITGCFITLFDLHFNLLKFGIEHHFDIYIKNHQIGFKYYNFMKKCVCPSLSKNASIKYIHEDNIIHSDIIITTTEYLSSNCFVEGVQNNFKFHTDCNLLIFLDTLGLWIGDIYGVLNVFQEYIKDSNSLLLGSPFNLKYSNIFKNSEEYYHKFSDARMQYLIKKFSTPLYSKYYDSFEYKQIKENQIYPASDDEKTAHNYAGYIYKRWFQRKNIYAENIGKMIYENVLLNKYTYYSNENKCIDDGLTWYFKYLDLDDNISQIMNNDKNRKMIIDKLFMKEDDLILKILK